LGAATPGTAVPIHDAGFSDPGKLLLVDRILGAVSSNSDLPPPAPAERLQFAT
jgi:hypothetical protein